MIWIKSLESMGEGKNQLPKVIPWPWYTHTHTQTHHHHTHTQKNSNKIKDFFLLKKYSKTNIEANMQVHSGRVDNEASCCMWAFHRTKTPHNCTDQLKYKTTIKALASSIPLEVAHASRYLMY